MYKINISGSLDVGKLVREDSIKKMRQAMFKAKPVVQGKLRSQVSQSFNVRKSSFPRAFKGWVSYSDRERMPVAVFKFVVPWAGAHAGNTVIESRGRGLLIPLARRGGRRFTQKRWRALLAQLTSQGNLYFRKINGHVLAFAETLRESDLSSFGFNVTYANAYGKRKRHAEIPIGILVPSVRMKQRIDPVKLGQMAAEEVVRAWAAANADE